MTDVISRMGAPFSGTIKYINVNALAPAFGGFSVSNPLLAVQSEFTITVSSMGGESTHPEHHGNQDGSEVPWSHPIHRKIDRNDTSRILGTAGNINVWVVGKGGLLTHIKVLCKVAGLRTQPGWLVRSTEDERSECQRGSAQPSEKRCASRFVHNRPALAV
jgi:hypothetical protein